MENTFNAYPAGTAAPANVIYSHPDGEGQIHYDAENKRLYVTHDASEPELVSFAVMGPWGLRQVAIALLQIAEQLDDEGGTYDL